MIMQLKMIFDNCAIISAVTVTRSGIQNFSLLLTVCHELFNTQCIVKNTVDSTHFLIPRNGQQYFPEIHFL